MVFFLSQENKELAEILGTRKTSVQYKEYNRILETINDSIALHIHMGSIPDFDTEQRSYLSFNTAVNWAKQDWKSMIKKLESSDEDENWLIVFLARGGLILLDEIENDIDDFVWTFIKPKVNPKPHESDDIFEEYSDDELDAKLKQFKSQQVNILFIEDIVEEDEYESNLANALEVIAGKFEDYDITIGETDCLALLTRTAVLAGITVYGLLVSYHGGIQADWGNDMSEGEDYFDFADLLETVVDHDV